MRGLVGPIVVLAVLCAAAPARAGEVSLWACRGPDGAALGPVTTAVNGDAVVEPGCARGRFTRPDPASGSEALARVDVPPATTLTGVRLDRMGRGPGYSALTSVGALESADADGVANFVAGGDWVALRLRCDAADRCADAGLAGFELRSATLTVQDTTEPAVVVGGVREPASGTLDLDVRGTDTGLGLWRARRCSTARGSPARPSAAAPSCLRPTAPSTSRPACCARPRRRSASPSTPRPSPTGRTRSASSCLTLPATRSSRRTR